MRPDREALSAAARHTARSLAVSVAVCVACISCTSPDDQTYTRSYDTCILKNASHGGDEDSRTTATDICARHFIRAATPAEAEASRVKAEITPASKTAPPAPADAASNGLSDADVGLAPQGASISATLTNNDDNIIIKKVKIEAFFYSKPPSKSDGMFDAAGSKGSLYWEFEREIAPGDTETVTGNFGDKPPPSPFYSAHAEATVVLPHTDHATTNTLKEVP